MTSYQETIAKIKSADLGPEDHGIFTFHVDLDYGGSGQGLPGYQLVSTDAGDKTGAFVKAMLDLCAVDRWSKVAGKTVIAVRDEGYGGMVRGLKPLPTERGTGFMLSDIFGV